MKLIGDRLTGGMQISLKRLLQNSHEMSYRHVTPLSLWHMRMTTKRDATRGGGRFCSGISSEIESPAPRFPATPDSGQ